MRKRDFTTTSISLALLFGGCSQDSATSTADGPDSGVGKPQVASSPKVAPRALAPATKRLDTEPLKHAEKMTARQLRNFLAGKQLQPPGLVWGMEELEADGTWRAYIEATIASSREGVWDVRPGADGKPELCTWEMKRNGEEMSLPRGECRKISVSRSENRAELFTAHPVPRSYFATISRIEK